eukprot:g3223.t1
MQSQPEVSRLTGVIKLTDDREELVHKMSSVTLSATKTIDPPAPPTTKSATIAKGDLQPVAAQIRDIWSAPIQSSKEKCHFSANELLSSSPLDKNFINRYALPDFLSQECDVGKVDPLSFEENSATVISLPYRCPACNISFFFAESLRDHFNDQHPNSKVRRMGLKKKKPSIPSRPPSFPYLRKVSAEEAAAREVCAAHNISMRSNARQALHEFCQVHGGIFEVIRGIVRQVGAEHEPTFISTPWTLVLTKHGLEQFNREKEELIDREKLPAYEGRNKAICEWIEKLEDERKKAELNRQKELELVQHTSQKKSASTHNNFGQQSYSKKYNHHRGRTGRNFQMVHRPVCPSNYELSSYGDQRVSRQRIGRGRNGPDCDGRWYRGNLNRGGSRGRGGGRIVEREVIRQSYVVDGRQFVHQQQAVQYRNVQYNGQRPENTLWYGSQHNGGSYVPYHQQMQGYGGHINR